MIKLNILPLLFVILAVSVGCKRGTPDISEGEIVRLDSFCLFVKDKGHESPTVIIEGGLGCGTHYYDDLFERIGEVTRVISYDHAGIENSSVSPNPRTLDFFVSELRELMEVKEIHPPIILVGHSMGGHIARYYAWQYPDEVAGIVLLDPTPEGWFNYIRSTRTPDERARFEKYFHPDSSKWEGTHLEELRLFGKNDSMIMGKNIPSSIPVKVYTGPYFSEDSWRASVGYRAEDMEVWIRMQGEMLTGVEDGEQIVRPRVGHMFHRQRPALVMRGIEELIDRSRDMDQ